MSELDDAVYAEIESLCKQGDELANEDDSAAAIDLYERAWKLLPDPKEQWDGATWILVAIGDAHFLSEDFKAARSAFERAVSCPGGFGNPFVHLRLGQTNLELGDDDVAANELTRAYALEGSRIFEAENPKYFAFLKTRIRAPLGGWESKGSHAE